MNTKKKDLPRNAMPTLDSLGSRLEWARKEKRMSQSELAQSLGLNQTTIGKIERGEIEQPRELLAIAEKLEVSPAWLMFGITELERLTQDGINIALEWQALPNESKALFAALLAKVQK